MAKGRVQDAEAVQLYFAQIGDSRPLSREREAELAARIQEGDIAARDELVCANLRFVIDVAKRYQHRGLSLGELVGAGNLGLITAAERFDGSRGLKFISYAVWWIRQAISQALVEETRTVRLPVNQLSLLTRITTAHQSREESGDRHPDGERIATSLGVDRVDVWDTLLQGRPACSLDETAGEGETGKLLNVLSDERLASPDAALISDELRRHVDALLAELDERESFIVRRYYGLDGEQAWSLARIGERLQLTRERVRQLKERALGKLRGPRLREHLRETSDGG